MNRNVVVVDHPLVQHKLSLIRSKEISTGQFRALLHEIAPLMLYEATRDLPLTTREADTITNKVYIQDLLASGELEKHLGESLDPARTHVFLCGNPKMIGVPEKDRQTGERVYPRPTGVVEILEQRGFKTDQPNIKFKGNIHYEEYW